MKYDVSISDFDPESYMQSNGLEDILTGLIPGEKLDFSVKHVVGRSQKPFTPQFRDISRLHYLVRKYKVTTILEFGVGNSTVIMADALKRNMEDYGDFVEKNLRVCNPWEIHSLDTSEKYIKLAQEKLPPTLEAHAHFHFSECSMTQFNGQICTEYETLPNICPKLIYLDGPDQVIGINGEVNGISTHPLDRMPMACDILKIEPFLTPGTILIVDGRTANTSFLLNNFKRPWEHTFYRALSLHILVLNDLCLGKINERELNFMYSSN